MFCTFFFFELAPVQMPFDFLPKVSNFFLDKDLSFWIALIILSFIVFYRLRKDYEILVTSDSFLSHNSFFFVLFILAGIFSCVEIAYCDERNAFLPPPSPGQLPEEPLTPPAAPPVPEPAVVIPQLEQPLLSDEDRRNLLYQRYLILNFGGDDNLRRMVSIIDTQMLVERHVEAALVDDGFHPNSIGLRYNQIRGALHSPQGELLSERAYQSYVTQIRERGTRNSVPYRRILSQIRNYDLLLERL